jgi:hypothetical protein
MFGKNKSQESIKPADKNLSPTSFARQFVVVKGGDSMDDEDLAKNMNALSLKISGDNNQRQQQRGGSSSKNNDTLLDFDADSDGVFEDDNGGDFDDDDSDDDGIQSDTASGGGKGIGDAFGNVISNLKKSKMKKKNNKVSNNKNIESFRRHPRKGGSSNSRGSKSPYSYASSGSSRAMKDAGGRRGGGGGGATSASSTSTSMADNASVGTSESEGDLGGGGKAKKIGHGSDSAEDYTDDEDEGEDGYKPGGYHPVKVGEVYNQR